MRNLVNTFTCGLLVHQINLADQIKGINLLMISLFYSFILKSNIQIKIINLGSLFFKVCK